MAVNATAGGRGAEEARHAEAVSEDATGQQDQGGLGRRSRQGAVGDSGGCGCGGAAGCAASKFLRAMKQKFVHGSVCSGVR